MCSNAIPMPLEKTKIHKLTAVPKREKWTFTSVEEAEQDVCPKCYGTGMEIVQGKGARICSCRKTRGESRQMDSVRLPKRYDGFHFHNYKPQTAEQEIAFKYATSLTMEYPAVKQGLLLMGGVGIGKTHLAVSILKGLTERGFSCLFYDFGSLLKEIQDS